MNELRPYEICPTCDRASEARLGAQITGLLIERDQAEARAERAERWSARWKAHAQYWRRAWRHQDDLVRAAFKTVDNFSAKRKEAEQQVRDLEQAVAVLAQQATVRRTVDHDPWCWCRLCGRFLDGMGNHQSGCALNHPTVRRVLGEEVGSA